MAKSDIFLRKNRVEVVGGGGREEQNGREQGDLEVTVDKQTEPSVTLNADRANVTLGGGGGDAPEGDVKLLDASGTNRVQISAEGGNRPGSERVWINGGDGSITLGEEIGKTGDGKGIQLRGTTDSDYTGAYLSVGEPSSDNETIESDNGRVELQALTDPQRSGAAGMAEFRPFGRAETSVSIRGDQAQISLGYSVTERKVSGGDNPVGGDSPYGVGPGVGSGGRTVDYEVVAGENGELWFDDGTGANFRLVAEEGKLKVTGPDSLDTEYLVIDPRNEEIRTQWTFVEK